MYCQHCGEEVDDNAEFCRHCGQNINPSPTPSRETAADRTNTEIEPADSFAFQTEDQWESSYERRKGEQILRTFKANRTQSEGRAVGGKLYLTNQRLLFEPGSVDSQIGSEEISIELTAIESVSKESRGGKGWKDTIFGGGLRNRLRIDVNENATELFVVSDLSTVIDEINLTIEGGTEGETVTVTDTDDDSSTTFTKAVYAIARLIQVVLAVVAVVLLIGGLDMNVLQFAVIGIFALVLFAIVGVVEILVVRPFT
jgi:hypothetical protein